MCGKQGFLFLLKRTLLTFVCSVSSTTTIKEESDTASLRAEYCIYMGFKRIDLVFTFQRCSWLAWFSRKTGQGPGRCTVSKCLHRLRSFILNILYLQMGCRAELCRGRHSAPRKEYMFIYSSKDYFKIKDRFLGDYISVNWVIKVFFFSPLRIIYDANN